MKHRGRSGERSCELIIVPEIGHRIGRLYRAEGKTAALFQNRVFEKALSR